MADCMTFPDTVEEFMEQYKVVDTEQVYTNGTEFVPIFRMKQWFDHKPEPHWIKCSERLPEENRTVIASTEDEVYPESRYTKEYGWEWAYEFGSDYWEELTEVKAWMPLPEPYQEGEG